jgi:aspartyl-tRNA(Asn)/glutamyl-tRNA(Gln) amidotransferase subunit C
VFGSVYGDGCGWRGGILLGRNDYNSYMTLTPIEVAHIAELARLDLTEEEITRYGQQLSAILEYFARLQELDTSDIPPTSSTLSLTGVLRSDEPGDGLSRVDLLRNAPDVEAEQFRVPPILDEQ